LFEENGELLTAVKQQNDTEGRFMVEEIFNEILNSQDGDYTIHVQVLAILKPSGW
jgi:hypothetical protein